MTDWLWPTLTWVLIFEGLLPLLVPRFWRRMLTEMLRLQDGQIRFFGLLCVLGGLALSWVVS